MEEELKHWKGKNIFTLGDEEFLPMVRNSFGRILLQQLEELERWVEENIKKYQDERFEFLEPEKVGYNQALEDILSHIREQKEIINKK